MGGVTPPPLRPAGDVAIPRGMLLWMVPLALVVGVLLVPDVNTRLLPAPAAALILALVAVVMLRRGVPRLLVLVPLAGAFLPSSTAGFLASLFGLGLVLLFVLWRRALRPVDALDVAFFATLGWSILSWLANLGVETDLWSLPVYALTFWAPWIILMVGRADAWSASEAETARRVWWALLLVQLAPALMKPLVAGPIAAYLVPALPLELIGIRLPGREAVVAAADSTFGTMLSAHHLGVLLVIGLTYLATWWLLERRRDLVLLGLPLAFVLLMADAKHVLLTAAVVVMPLLLMLAWAHLSRAARRALVVGLLVLGLGLAAQARRLVLEVGEAGLWRPIIGLIGFNPKVQLVARTYALMADGGLQTWVGFGPGAYASRAASSRATEVLYKEGGRLPAVIPAHTAPSYGSTVYDLYTAEIATTTRFRSGMLTNPFSSLIGIVAEHGVVGTILLVTFFVVLARRGLSGWRDRQLAPAWRAAGATLFVAVPFLFLLSIFDSYFEQPDVTIPIALLGLLVLVAPTRGAPAEGSQR